MDGQIFLRLRHRIKTGNDQLIYLEDIAQITGDEFAVQKLSKMPIYHVSKKDRHIAVLDIMHVVKTIKKTWPDIDIQTVGGAEAIVEIDTGKHLTFSRFICVRVAPIICRSGACHYEFPRGCQYAARSYPPI